MKKLAEFWPVGALPSASVRTALLAAEMVAATAGLGQLALKRRTSCGPMWS